MSRPIPQETNETRRAFRAGVKGLPFAAALGPWAEFHVQTDMAQGVNERHMQGLEHLPGLSDPLGAYETGRALRMIGLIFDGQGAPITFAQTFLAKLGEAVLYFALRGERQPWGAEDTAFVFLETCALASAPREFREQTRVSIVEYARKRPVTINVP